VTFETKEGQLLKLAKRCSQVISESHPADLDPERTKQQALRLLNDSLAL
jgi:hypothetical protein